MGSPFWTEVFPMDRDGKTDVCLDVPNDGYAGRLEVLEGPTGRRRRSEEERARIAAESLLPGAQVAEVARRHGVTRWQVYDWRKRLRAGRLRSGGGSCNATAMRAMTVSPASGGQIGRASCRERVCQ